MLLALCAGVVFLRLGAPATTDSDEPLYAEDSPEMLQSGDWITPHYNYDTRFEKPVFFYWLVAAAYKIGGVGEAQARVFSALSGVGLVGIAYLIGRRWIGPWPGFLAGAITATSFGIFWMARESLPDLPLAFFLTVGVWAAIEAVTPDTRRPFGWLMLSSIAIGIAILTKGPVAVAVPAVVIALLLVWEIRFARREGRRFALPVGVAAIALGVVVLLLVVVPWNYLIERAHPGYLRYFFFGENLQRFATTKFNDVRGREPWYYVPIVLGGLAPWSPFVLLWMAPAWRVIRRRRLLSRTEARLIIWALAPLALFSIS